MHSYYYDDSRRDGPPTEAGGGPSRIYPMNLYPTHAPVKKRRRTWVAAVVFSVFLVLMLGAASILLALNSGLGQFTLDLPKSTPAGGYTYIPLPTTSPEARTTVARAPIGTGVELQLEDAGGVELKLQELYQKCIPSIVGIRSYRSGGGATGTGVIMAADGYIITNYHVIQGANEVDVILQDDSVHTAKLVGGDQTNDLAVLKIDAEGLTPAEFGDSDDLQVGDVSVAIGNPLGEELRGTMTSGIISAINRDVRNDGNTMTLIQTTAALNSGNSGGALLNIYGQVVGITNMKMMSNYDTIEGLGFAIPSSTTKTVVDALIAEGQLSGRPTLGITVYTLTEEMAQEEGLTPGVYVSDVEERSGSYKGGLRAGDIIVGADGQEIATLEDLNAVKSAHQAGDTLSLDIVRDGASKTIKVKLIEKYELDE